MSGVGGATRKMGLGLLALSAAIGAGTTVSSCAPRAPMPALPSLGAGLGEVMRPQLGIGNDRRHCLIDDGRVYCWDGEQTLGGAIVDEVKPLAIPAAVTSMTVNSNAIRPDEIGWLAFLKNITIPTANQCLNARVSTDNQNVGNCWGRI